MTIHEVSPTPDFKQAFVYLGVIGKEHEKGNGAQEVNSSRGVIQRDLQARRVEKPAVTRVPGGRLHRARRPRPRHIINNLPPMADPCSRGRRSAQIRQVMELKTNIFAQIAETIRRSANASRS